MRNSIGLPSKLKWSRFSPRGGNDGYYRSVMAAGMKVLKIQRIIQHLIKSGAIELSRTDLELDNKDDACNKQHDVCPFAHARDGKLKGDPAVDISELALRDINLT